MLRSLLAFLLLCCLVPAAAAGPVTLGARAGSSIPNLRDRGGNALSSGWSSRVAPYFGVSAEVPVTAAFSLQAEVNYAAQGGKRNGMQAVTFPLPGFEGVTPYADFKNTAKLDYLEIPILAKLHFGPARRLFADLGPYAGFLLSAKTVTSGQSLIYVDGQPVTDILLDFGATTDNKADLHVFNWGLQAGAGYQQALGRGLISLEVRGGLGLANIQKDTATNGKNGTGVLVIAVGYAMRVGG